jgi:division protein CdvB (Snf7/Vps24/ESCRT-III family)
MTRLESAMSRLDAAMARLDAAVAENAHRGFRDRELLEGELSMLRETHVLLQSEARQVADRLDEVIGRLHDVTEEDDEEVDEE